MKSAGLRLLLLTLMLLGVPTTGLAEGQRILPLMLVVAADYVGDRTDTAVLADVEQVMSVANRYLAPLGVRAVLAGIQLERGQGSRYTLGAAGGPETLLQLIKLEWSERPVPARAAVAVLLRNAPGGVSGLSFSSTVCRNPTSAILYAAAGVGEQSTMRLGATVAHEIGHLLGMEHDAKLYANGVSLMWPQVSAFANGFSATSRAELASYEERGGMSCLPSDFQGGQPQQLAAGGATQLQFLGGERQELTAQEGSELRYQVQLKSDEPGAAIWAEGLPPGAVFDPLSGELSYTPEYSTVSAAARERIFTVVFTARTTIGLGTMTLQLRVRDLNRPPQFVDSTATAISAAPGERLAFSVIAADPDGDVVQLKQRVLSRTIRSDALRARCRRARCDFTFASKERRSGVIELEISARDTQGATARKVVTLRSVVGGADRATLQLPAELGAVLGSGQPVVFSLSGGEAELDIATLPPGWALRREDRTRLSLYALGGASKSGAAAIELLIREAGGVRRVPVTVYATEGAAAAGEGVWPGARTAPLLRLNESGSEAGGTLYDFAFGRWRDVDCAGVVNAGSAQFGGLIGDVPLQLFFNHRAHRAVYRVTGERGWWLIDREAGIESIAWGLKRDVPIAGDFDGDGSSDPAVFRPSDNSFYLKLSRGGERIVHLPTLAQQFGLLRQPFAADWDGDGLDDPSLVVRSAQGVVAQVLVSGKAGAEFRVALASESVTDPFQPIVADLDNDGRADLALVTPGKQLVLAASSRASAHQLSLPTGLAAEPFIAECAGDSGQRSSRLFLLDRARGILLRFAELSGAIPAVSTDFSLFAEAFSQAPEGFRPLLPLQAARARAATLPSFGALGDSSASTRVVTRRTGARLAWLLHTGAGPQSLAVAPDTSTYRSAGTFASSRLLSYSDGLWESVGRDGDRDRALWGTIGDLPVPADYNGDGVTDLAIFRHSDHSWWIRFSGPDGPTLNTRVGVWGASGDQPVPGDYDGDGATDFAVFRRNGDPALFAGKPEGAALWLVQFADGRVAVKQFGEGSDTPVPADYDGDGITDFAVWRAASGEWIVQLPSGVKRVQWGLEGDEPVHGDFDGDGRIDLAVWRPETGVWFSKPFDLVPTVPVVTQFGLPGDEPLGVYHTVRIY